MQRSRFASSCLAALLGWNAVAWSADARRVANEQTSQHVRPNFILAMADDQGWGDVGYYGHSPVQTPILDEMAASGLRFDRFYAAAPVCSPTRGSVLTGRHPNRFGCFSWGHTLRPQEITIAETLQEAGYATGHFGKWHLGSVWGDSPVSPGASGFDEWLSSPNFYENSPLFSHRGEVVATEGESSMVTVEAALPFIRHAAERGQPFLAVIWFGNPHSPHEAQEHLRALYLNEPEKAQHFLGEVTGIDQSLGRLREELEELNIRDNTVLWYTSDNGAIREGSTGGLRGRKGNLYEGGIRVPAIIEWPALVTTPRVVDAACGTVDIYPTLLELARLEPPPHQPQLDGTSLAPLFDGDAWERPEPLGFWVYPQGGRRTPSHEWMVEMRRQQQAGESPTAEQLDAAAGEIGDRPEANGLPGHSAWIDGAFKLHRMPRDGRDPKYELYNLVEDRAEERDLSAENPELVREMAADLEAWQRSVVSSLQGDDYGSGHGAQ